MPKPSKDQSERDQYTVVLEDVQDKLKILAEGVGTLRQQMEVRFQGLESGINQRFAILEQAIRETCEEVKQLGKRLETHEKTHAL
jgi:hypothetical protein